MKVKPFIILIFLIPVCTKAQKNPDPEENKLMIIKKENPDRLFTPLSNSFIKIYANNELYYAHGFSFSGDSAIIINSDTISIAEIEKLRIRYPSGALSKLAGGFVFLSTTVVCFFGFGLAVSGIFVYPEAASIAFASLIPIAGIGYFGYKYSGNLMGIRKFRTDSWNIKIRADVK